jgi:hypothetical protein
MPTFSLALFLVAKYYSNIDIKLNVHESKILIGEIITQVSHIDLNAIERGVPFSI